jgi:hypothetical protein
VAFLLLLLGSAVGIALIVYSVFAHGDAARSSYTQAHGVRRAARVISEDIGTGKDPTSTVVVQLSEPVNGHDTTTVHIPFAPAFAYFPGTPVTVVVDPQDPGYAELPGAPYISSGVWEALPGVTLVTVTLLLPFGYGVAALVRLRSRRRLRRFLLR